MSGAVVKRENGGLIQHPELSPVQTAAAFAESGMFPDIESQAQALVKIVAGHEMGIGPMAAMMGINIIQGKVTLSANLLAAQVKANPVYDFLPREHTAEVCRIEFFQNGESVGVSEFTLDDAKRAGVGGGQNYRKYPKAMLFARALTQGVRWFCPDVTAGSPAYVPEELGAQVDEEGAPVDQPAPEPVTAEIVEEPKSVEVIDAERVKALAAAVEQHRGQGMTFDDLSLLMGAAGIDAPLKRSVKSVHERLTSLSDEQADKLQEALAA